MTDRAAILMLALALAACDRAETPAPAPNAVEQNAAGGDAEMLDTSPDSLAAANDIAPVER